MIPMTNETRELLHDAASLFLAYAHQHLAKDPPQGEKAQTNLDMARRIVSHLDPSLARALPPVSA